MNIKRQRSQFWRREGQSPIYTRRQTAAYVSRLARLQRGTVIQPDQVRPTAKGYECRFLSPRGPASTGGHWIVTAERGPFGDGDGGGAGGGGDEPSGNCWQPELPPNGQYCVMEVASYTDISLSEEDWDDSNQASFGWWNGYPPTWHGGLPGDSADFDRVTENSETIYWNGSWWTSYGSSAQQWTYRTMFWAPDPYPADGHIYLVEYYRKTYYFPTFPEMPSRWYGGTRPSEALEIWSNKCGLNSLSNPTNYPPTATDVCAAEPPPDTGGAAPPGYFHNGGLYAYSCSCPDYSKESGALALPLYPSEHGSRSWVGSNAGAIGYCKHIISSALAIADMTTYFLASLAAQGDLPAREYWFDRGQAWQERYGQASQKSTDRSPDEVLQPDYVDQVADQFAVTAGALAATTNLSGGIKQQALSPDDQQALEWELEYQYEQELAQDRHGPRVRSPLREGTSYKPPQPVSTPDVPTAVKINQAIGGAVSGLFKGGGIGASGIKSGQPSVPKPRPPRPPRP